MPKRGTRATATAASLHARNECPSETEGEVERVPLAVRCCGEMATIEDHHPQMVASLWMWHRAG